MNTFISAVVKAVLEFVYATLTALFLKQEEVKKAEDQVKKESEPAEAITPKSSATDVDKAIDNELQNL
jgi:hypothetical protein